MQILHFFLMILRVFAPKVVNFESPAQKLKRFALLRYSDHKWGRQANLWVSQLTPGLTLLNAADNGISL